MTASSTTIRCWRPGCMVCCTFRRAIWRMPRTGTTAPRATFAAVAAWKRSWSCLRPHWRARRALERRATSAQGARKAFVLERAEGVAGGNQGFDDRLERFERVGVDLVHQHDAAPVRPQG